MKKRKLLLFREKKSSQKNEFRDADFYVKGIEDATENYRTTGPVIGSTVSTLLFSPAGLVTSIAVASVKPKPPLKNKFNEKYVANATYNKAYIQEAHRKKKKGVWTGFGISTAILLIISAAAAN